MYRVYFYSEECQNWVQDGQSDSFSNAWDYARACLKGKRWKIIGPEGVFESR